MALLGRSPGPDAHQALVKEVLVVAAGAAYRIRYLLRHADKRQRMGTIGHQFVRNHFLLIRNLRDYRTMLLCLDHPEAGALVV